MSKKWKFPWEKQPIQPKKEKTPFSDRLASVADKGKRLVIGGAAIIGGIAALLVLVFEVSDSQARIDAFDVPTELEKCGWSGKVIARKLLDGRSQIAEGRRLIARGRATKVSFAEKASIAFGIEKSALSLPQLGTFDPVIGYIRRFIGRPRKIISGEMRGTVDPGTCELVNFTISIRYPDERVRTLQGVRKQGSDGTTAMQYSRSIGCKHDTPSRKLAALLTELSDPLLLASYIWACDQEQALELVRPFINQGGSEGLLARNIVGLVAIARKKYEVAAQWYRDQIEETELDAWQGKPIEASALAGTRLSEPELAEVRALYLYNMAVARKRNAQRLAKNGFMPQAHTEFSAVSKIVDLAENTGTETSEFHTIAGETFVEWSLISDGTPFQSVLTEEEAELLRINFKRAKLLRSINSYEKAVLQFQGDDVQKSYYPYMQLAYSHLALAEIDAELLKRKSAGQGGENTRGATQGAENKTFKLVKESIKKSIQAAKDAMRAEPLSHQPYVKYSDIISFICSKFQPDMHNNVCSERERIAAIERSLLMDQHQSRPNRLLANIKMRLPGRKAEAFENFTQAVSAYYVTNEVLNTVAIDQWADALDSDDRPVEAMKVRKRVLCERPDHRNCRKFRDQILTGFRNTLGWSPERISDFMQCKRSEIPSVALARLETESQTWNATCAYRPN